MGTWPNTSTVNERIAPDHWVFLIELYKHQNHTWVGNLNFCTQHLFPIRERRRKKNGKKKENHFHFILVSSDKVQAFVCTLLSLNRSCPVRPSVHFPVRNSVSSFLFEGNFEKFAFTLLFDEITHKINQCVQYIIIDHHYIPNLSSSGQVVFIHILQKFSIRPTEYNPSLNQIVQTQFDYIWYYSKHVRYNFSKIQTIFGTHKKIKHEKMFLLINFKMHLIYFLKNQEEKTGREKTLAIQNIFRFIKQNNFQSSSNGVGWKQSNSNVGIQVTLCGYDKATGRVHYYWNIYWMDSIQLFSFMRTNRANTHNN